MICKHCGYEIAEGSAFCSTCGKVVDETETVESPVSSERRDELGGRILTFGILSIAFALTFFLSFLGIIFAAVAKSMAATYAREFGETEGRATVGKNLAKPGLIVGIILTVLAVIYCFALVVSIMMYM